MGGAGVRIAPLKAAETTRWERAWFVVNGRAPGEWGAYQDLQRHRHLNLKSIALFERKPQSQMAFATRGPGGS